MTSMSETRTPPYTVPMFIPHARMCWEFTAVGCPTLYGSTRKERKMRVKNRTRRPPSVRSVREGYSASNSIAAQIISQDTARWPAGSLAQQWASRILQRMTKTVTGSLFEATGRQPSVAVQLSGPWWR